MTYTVTEVDASLSINTLVSTALKVINVLDEVLKTLSEFDGFLPPAAQEVVTVALTALADIEAVLEKL